MAAVTLAPTPDGGTELVLVHRGVPKDLIPETERAWRDQYWSRIKAYLDRRAIGCARRKGRFENCPCRFEPSCILHDARLISVAR